MKLQVALLKTCLGLALFLAKSAAADPFLSTVTVGNQSPATLSPGATATFTVTVTKTNSGAIDAYMSISGLPAGATAAFLPSPVHFTPNGAWSLITTLTISTSASLAPGVYPLTVTARDGSSGNLRPTGTGTLIVGNGGSSAIAPLIVSISLLGDKTPAIVVSGTANARYQVQATDNLSSPVWVSMVTNTTSATGLFTFNDQSATNLTTRFYRAATVQ